MADSAPTLPPALPSPDTQDPVRALEYLIAVRNYIAEQQAPAGYVQHPHAPDARVVGSSVNQPAMLDASYTMGTRGLLSVSIPDFVQLQPDVVFNADGKMHAGQGITSAGIANCLRTVMASLGVELGQSKYGYSLPERTHYVEIDTKSNGGYQDGKGFIQALVHGDNASDQELLALVAAAKTANGKARGEEKKPNAPLPSTDAYSPRNGEKGGKAVKFVGGGAASAAGVSIILPAAVVASNGGGAESIALAGAKGGANFLLPGVADGFKGITDTNAGNNWVDQVMNAAMTGAQGFATGAYAVAGASALIAGETAAAAPATVGTSLVGTAGAASVTVVSLSAATVAELSALGVSLTHDGLCALGVTKQGGVIYGMADAAYQLAYSKAANRVRDWAMGNDAKVQQDLHAVQGQLAHIGIDQNQLVKILDQNHDGKFTAQEVRDYLITHNVAADVVNKSDAEHLTGLLESVLSQEALAATQAASRQAAAAGVTGDPSAASGSPPLQRPVSHPEAGRMH